VGARSGLVSKGVRHGKGSERLRRCARMVLLALSEIGILNNLWESGSTIGITRCLLVMSYVYL
jgi:hypothetical protein